MRKLQKRILQLTSNYINQKGSVAVIVAILSVALIGIAALAVDIGYVAVSKNELQNAADAAALAGAGELGRIYIANKSEPLITGDLINIKTAAIDVGVKNNAATLSANIQTNDVLIGVWNADNNTFTAGSSNQNAVKVTAKPSGHDSIPLGSVTTFFANVFGTSNVAVSANAIASLTAQCTAANDILVPFGLKDQSSYCSGSTNKTITFGATGTSCAGWTSYDNRYPNTTDLKIMLQKMINSEVSKNNCVQDFDNCFKKGDDTISTYSPPGAVAGSTEFYYNNKDATPLYGCLKNLFDCKKDKTTGVWTTDVVRYESSAGCNPGDWLMVVGFATIKITGVDPAPSVKKIYAEVDCDHQVVQGKGGCDSNGLSTFGSIPGLVDKK